MFICRHTPTMVPHLRTSRRRAHAPPPLAPQVIVALLLGVFSGCLLLNRGNPLLASARTFDSYFVDALADRGHAGVVLFTLLLGGKAPPKTRTRTCDASARRF